MGADLLIIALPAPTADRDELHRRVDALDEESLSRTVEYMHGMSGEEYEAELFDGTWQDYVRTYLKDAVDVLLSEDRRDTTTITVGSETIVLAGGMSWGDAPSDAYDYLNALAESGVELR